MTSEDPAPFRSHHNGKSLTPPDLSWPARGRPGKLTAAAAIAVLALAAAPAGEHATLKAPPRGANFSFSGAATGALHITPANATCSASTFGAGAGIFVTLGKLKGIGGTVSWVLHITTLSSGSFKLAPHSVPVVTVQDTTATGLGPLWSATSGTLTAHAGKGTFTGAVHANLTSTKARLLHVSGTWDCAPTSG